MNKTRKKIPETFYMTVITSPQWRAWEKEVARRMKEHAEKGSKLFTGVWDVDESRELDLLSQGHFQDFIKFITNTILDKLEKDLPEEDERVIGYSQGWNSYRTAVLQKIRELKS